ncbi:hypothetical protein [Desulfoluna spongiiphila]|uniref:Uncharacterized protein n=1 Tax=Desulfoluna spongiiphila TaxID=419481 RepID=A0A1G5G106_9BACT|nr:hypothetical protein [Desulfoluna spongiiphila]SCY45049.1 hypothetical protein SAMN05216233_109127 [Desulfoluna spongiiphila]
MLSCTCNDWDGDGPAWYWPDDFTVMPWVVRRKPCQSCGLLIDIGSVCISFIRFRPPESDIEERIEGEEVPLATHYLCEACGEIFFNLNAAGYCVGPYDDLQDDLEEYQEITGFKSEEPMENSIQHQTKYNYTICPVCGVYTMPKHVSTAPDKVVRKWICANPACGEVRTEVEGR